MEFENTEEFVKYIRKRAVKRTKFKLTLYSMKTKKKKATNETLEKMYNASLKEIEEEVKKELKNGDIVILDKTIKIKSKSK